MSKLCLSYQKLQNEKNQLMEPIYVEREKGGTILYYVDFSKICNVIRYFTEL